MSTVLSHNRVWVYPKELYSSLCCSLHKSSTCTLQHSARISLCVPVPCIFVVAELQRTKLKAAPPPEQDGDWRRLLKCLDCFSVPPCKSPKRFSSLHTHIHPSHTRTSEMRLAHPWSVAWLLSARLRWELCLRTLVLLLLRCGTSTRSYASQHNPVLRSLSLLALRNGSKLGLFYTRPVRMEFV